MDEQIEVKALNFMATPEWVAAEEAKGLVFERKPTVYRGAQVYLVDRPSYEAAVKKAAWPVATKKK